MRKKEVYDAENAVFAYELTTYTGPPFEINDLWKTENSEVVKLFLEFGFNSCLAGKRVIVKVNDLLKEIGEVLKYPPGKVLVTCCEFKSACKKMLLAFTHLKKKGYLIVVDQYALRRGHSKLLKLSDFVMVDFQTASIVQIFAAPQKAQKYSLPCIAVNLDTAARVDLAKHCNYQYFHGKNVDDFMY
nr:hypothetical protein [uncultured Anaeromusa sp.]